MECVKVQLKHTHLASVRKDLLAEFRRRFEVVNYLAWVRGMASVIYGVELNGPPDIQRLAQAIDKDYYRDIGEWLSELMRNALIQGNRYPLCQHQPAAYTTTPDDAR